MVDAERVGARLDRLEHLIERLERARSEGEERFLADEVLRMATERQLQLAIQICIDLGAQLVAELSIPPPTDYAGIFTALAGASRLDGDVAARLADAAKQRNVLVHMYPRSTTAKSSPPSIAWTTSASSRRQSRS